MVVTEEILVVEDHDSLVALRLMMGVIFGVGAQTPVTTKWCMENDPRPVGRGVF